MARFANRTDDDGRKLCRAVDAGVGLMLTDLSLPETEWIAETILEVIL